MKKRSIACLYSMFPALLFGHAQYNQIIRTHYYEEEMPITIFSHGVGGDHQQADFYKSLFCSKNYITFNYPNAPEKLFARNHKTGLAQQSEMDSLDYVIDMSIKYNQPVVMYGVSRGASAIINVIGFRVANKRSVDQVAAIVLESPFAHCEDIIQGYAQQFKLPPFFMRFLAKRFFKEYNKSKNAPIDWVSCIPKDMPILLICTSEDTIVPASSTKRLYAQLCKSGCTNVHLLEFPEGIHANIAWSRYGREYHTVLHAFYKRYNLPHNETMAELGNARFDACQPHF